MAGQQAQEKFRKMIFTLSGRLETSDCESISYLAGLPSSESTTGKANVPLHVLSSLEGNGRISPWDVEKLESLLSEIHHEELLPIVGSYKESKEYRTALKERKKKSTKFSAESKATFTGDHTMADGTTDQKKRLRSLYTLLITHITGLTQVMEILREELDRVGEGGGLDVAMERFLQVAEDGENFTDDLRKVFQDMGIKSNRNSTSSEGTPSADLETRSLKASSPPAMPPTPASPVTSAKQQQKKPKPLPRTRKTPQARQDLDIYENVGPIKQEEGCAVSREEYHQMVCSTPKVSRTVSTGGLFGEEEDTTGNTGDSGISEWIGDRVRSEDNLLDSSSPEKESRACRAHSEGAMGDSEKDTPLYTALLRRKDPASEYASINYGDDMQRC